VRLSVGLATVAALAVAACGTSSGRPTPAWTAAPPGSGASTSPAQSPVASITEAPLPIGSGTDSAQLFFAQFGAIPAPFHVRLESTLSGSTSGTAVEEADVDGRSYSAQLHVELAGIAAHDSQVINIDGTGYVADAGSANWQAYPDYDTVPPVNPFLELDATQWTDLGADAAHAGLDWVHSTTWTLPSDSESAAEVANVVFDLWLDDQGYPVSGTLAFQLTATARAPAVGYSANYGFSNVGDPVEIVAPSIAPSEGTVFTVTSNAFTATGTIPPQYTCDGANTAPPIGWTNLPAGTVELALVMDDPDARGFVHWVVVGIPASATGVGGGAPLPAGAREGRNDFNKVGYGGPCPPSGTHHYDFTLYALSAPLDVAATAKADEIERAATGITLATAVLTGSYTRGGG
jgi:Raf kinase inhibitor-like YbhB/YbcL family protein